MDSGTYTFTSESTVQERDNAINKLIDKYDSKKSGRSENLPAKGKGKGKSSTSISFIFIAEAMALGLVMLVMLV